MALRVQSCLDFGEGVQNPHPIAFCPQHAPGQAPLSPTRRYRRSEMRGRPHEGGQVKTDVAPHLLQPHVAVKHHEIRAVLFCFVLFLFCPGVIRSKLARSRGFWLREFRGMAVPPIFPPARSFRLRSDPATTSALASDVEQTLSLFLSAKAWRKGRVGC